MQQGEGAREGRHECTMTPRSDSQSSSRSDSALPRVTSCAQLSMCWQTAALGCANAPSTCEATRAGASAQRAGQSAGVRATRRRAWRSGPPRLHPGGSACLSVCAPPPACNAPPLPRGASWTHTAGRPCIPLPSAPPPSGPPPIASRMATGSGTHAQAHTHAGQGQRHHPPACTRTRGH